MVRINNQFKLPLQYESSEFDELCQKYMSHPSPGDKWKAAVGALVVEDQLLFIKRSEKLRTHKGQIGLPGGKREKGEQGPLETMAREFQEEVSISRDLYEFKGFLPSVFYQTNFSVIPCLLHYKKDLENLRQTVELDGESSHAFLVPLSLLKDLAQWKHGFRHGTETNGTLVYRAFLASEVEILVGGSFSTNPTLLWGATGRMIWNMIQMQL